MINGTQLISSLGAEAIERASRVQRLADYVAALSLEGARSSERQMIASGQLLMIANLAFSYATPLQKMHP